MKKKKTCLLTGGAGFIGGHLAERLLKEGNRVIVLDDLSTGSYSNIEHLEREYAQAGDFKFIFDSVLHERVVEDLVRESDEVYHLASAVGVQLIMDQPVKTIETIVEGTSVVLKCAARYRRRTMIFSTSEVYGKSADIPFREDGDRLEGPTTSHRWAYACAKSMDEFLALAHYKQTRQPVIIVRLFNTAGPRQTGHYGMVIPSFINRALKDEALSVFGTGKQSRCFCHVDDVIDALTALMSHEKAVGQIYNVGSSTEISIGDLAKKVIEQTGSKSSIDLIPYDVAYGEGFEDMQRRMPSTEKIHAAIGWEPKRSLEQIITDVAKEKKALMNQG